MNKKSILIAVLIYTIGVIVTIILFDRWLQPIRVDAASGETKTASETETSSDEYTDLRRLDEKLTAKDDDHRWLRVKQDLDQNRYDEYRLILDNEKLKTAKPGDIVAEWSFSGSEDAIDQIIVSVPRIYDCDVYSNALKKYGMLELFCYSQAGGSEAWSASADIFVYDKNALDEHQIIIQTDALGNYTGKAWLESSIPALYYWLSSEDYGKPEEVLANDAYKTASMYSYFRTSTWDNERYLGKTTFTKDSVNFDEGELSTLLERADQCNILGRKPIADYYNDRGEIYDPETEEYTLGAKNFSLTEFLSEISGPIAGNYKIEHGYNGFIYLYPGDRRDCVIAVNKDRTYVAISARHLYDKQDLDVTRDRLYIGTYYVDTSKTAEEIQIDGSNWLTLTPNTLEQLLHLLTKANIYWPVINADNLDLNG